jgi:hypothetical protein
MPDQSHRIQMLPPVEAVTTYTETPPVIKQDEVKKKTATDKENE